MNRLQKVSLIVGLLLQIPLSMHGMENAIVVEDQQLDIPLLEAVHRATLSLELRACIAPDLKTVESAEFQRLLDLFPWLAEYVAHDGLTIGEFIVMLCKEEFDKRGVGYINYWLEYEGPSCLVAPFDQVIRCIRANNHLQRVGDGQVELDNNTLNKIYYCTQKSEGHDLIDWGVYHLSGRVNNGLYHHNRFNLQSEADRARLLEAIEKPSVDELAVIREAHLIATFFSFIESDKVKAAASLLKKNWHLVTARKADIHSKKQFPNQLQFGNFAETPLETINRKYGKGVLNDKVKQFAALIIMSLSKPVPDNVYNALCKELRDLVDECRDDREQFRERWGKDVSIPDLALVYKIDKMDELKTHVNKRDRGAFQNCLDNNPWLVDFPLSDGRTIGQYIIQQYINSMEQTEHNNKQTRITKESHEYCDRANVLYNQFDAVLKKCTKDSSTLFKIDKDLFYFYNDDFCQKRFSNKWGNIWLSYDDDMDKRYDKSRLHYVRIEYTSANYYWNHNPALGEFRTSLTYYQRDELPSLDEHERAEFARARVVWKFFFQIEMANFSEALELLRDEPWVARSKKYSGMPNYVDLNTWYINRYTTNPLVALAERLIQGKILEEEQEYAPLLGALLLALGTDYGHQTQQHNLPNLLLEKACEGLNQLVQSFRGDQARFCLIHNPPVEEPVDDVDPVLTPEELEIKIQEEQVRIQEEQVQKKEQEEKEEREDAGKELVELEGQVAILSQSPSYTPSFRQVAAIGALVASSYFIGRRLAHRSSPEQKKPITGEKTASEKNVQEGTAVDGENKTPSLATVTG